MPELHLLSKRLRAWSLCRLSLQPSTPSRGCCESLTSYTQTAEDGSHCDCKCRGDKYLDEGQRNEGNESGAGGGVVRRAGSEERKTPCPTGKELADEIRKGDGNLEKVTTLHYAIISTLYFRNSFIGSKSP